MSGGSLNYSYQKVANLANDIQEILQDDNYKEVITTKALIHIQRLYKDLIQCSNKAYELEWALSGDTSIEDFINFCETGSRIVNKDT